MLDLFGTSPTHGVEADRDSLSHLPVVSTPFSNSNATNILESLRRAKSNNHAVPMLCAPFHLPAVRVSISRTTVSASRLQALTRPVMPTGKKWLATRASMEQRLRQDYPWTTSPLLVSAPMLKITMAPLAVAVSKAGGLGFLAGGFDLTSLAHDMQHAAELLQRANIPCPEGVLPIGVGFQNWGSDLQLAISTLKQYPPAAAWFFAPRQPADLVSWTQAIRQVTDHKTKIWIQIGTVAEAIEVAQTSRPDVIVVQGADGGGHGLQNRAGIISLLPEVSDALQKQNLGYEIPLIAAGGIADGRGVAAALLLGANGVAMGTRFLAAKEATIAKGYQDEILRVTDGGPNTVKTTVYDRVRGIYGWPEVYDGRGVANQTYRDAVQGMSEGENQKLYQEAMKQGDAGWGPGGRMTTYAGTGVGLIRDIRSAEDIITEVSRDAVALLASVTTKYPNVQ